MLDWLFSWLAWGVGLALSMFDAVFTLVGVNGVIETVLDEPLVSVTMGYIRWGFGWVGYWFPLGTILITEFYFFMGRIVLGVITTFLGYLFKAVTAAGGWVLSWFTGA